MLQANSIVLTRKQLYDEIWEISAAGVAKKYGAVYAHLLKQIKAAGIPVPPSGYWAMVARGKPTVKPELSEPFDEVIFIEISAPITCRKEQNETIAFEVPNSLEPTAEKPKSMIEDNHEQPIGAPPIQIEANTITDSISNKQANDEPQTVERYGQTYNVYDREKLYKEIWEAPVTEVAKRYKVSDVAIHKVCKSLDIPTPPLGYWAKLRAGKPVSVVPLSKSKSAVQKTGIQTGIASQPEPTKDVLAFLNEEDRALVLAVASQILLPEDSARMHPQIVAHRKAIAEWKKLKKNESRGLGRSMNDSAPFLVDTVSDDALPRIYRVIDALIKAMEPLGCTLTDKLSFVVNGETVQLSFSESQDKVDHIPSKDENLQLLKYEEDRKRHSWASKPNIRKCDYIYNGHISLTVNHKKNFRDRKSVALEEHLGEIMIEIYEAAEVLKQERLACEEAERKRQEEERRREERRKRYDAEVDRTHMLANLAEDYDIACKIRRYVSAVEVSNTESIETEGWIDWAKGKADWYDPTVAAEDELLGKRKHEKDAEFKKLEHARSWWW